MNLKEQLPENSIVMPFWANMKQYTSKKELSWMYRRKNKETIRKKKKSAGMQQWQSFLAQLLI